LSPAIAPLARPAFRQRLRQNCCTRATGRLPMQNQPHEPGWQRHETGV